MISTLFIIDSVVFNEEQSALFKTLTANWYVINNKNGRQLVDAIIQEDKFEEAQTALTEWNPSVVGKWNKDGSIIELNDTTEYVSLLPPIITIDENENVIETPRTEAINVHKFGGWGARQWA